MGDYHWYDNPTVLLATTGLVTSGANHGVSIGSGDGKGAVTDMRLLNIGNALAASCWVMTATDRNVQVYYWGDGLSSISFVQLTWGIYIGTATGFTRVDQGSLQHNAATPFDIADNDAIPLALGAVAAANGFSIDAGDLTALVPDTTVFDDRKFVYFGLELSGL